MGKYKNRFVFGYFFIILLSFHGILIYDKNIKYKLYIIKNKRKN